MSWRRVAPKTAVVAVIAAFLSSAGASAATSGPKAGYYIDPKIQAYIVLNSTATSTTSIQLTCSLASPAGSMSGTISLSGKAKIAKDGSFHYVGKAKVAGDTSAVKVDLTGAFKSGRYVGSFTMTSPADYCKPTHFNAKYYGLHPQG